MPFLTMLNEATQPALARSPSSVSEAASWTSLPAEIRQNILGLVSLPTWGRQNPQMTSPRVARFAIVCREWQVFFETRTFRRLVLDSVSVHMFDRIIRRDDTRLRYIRKLWLRVTLARYACPKCDQPEDERTQHRNNNIFESCIWSLLDTLRLWYPATHGPQGLSLMLSASSPSDTEHRFNRCEMKDDYPFHYAEDLNAGPGMISYHQSDPAQLVDTFYRREWNPPPLDGGHFKRIQGTPLRLDSPQPDSDRLSREYNSLPAVPVVRGLVIRRQFRREIHVRTLSRLLHRSFVALRWFRFERNISADVSQQQCFDEGFVRYLLPCLPRTLRQFSFTQWEIPMVEQEEDLDKVGHQVSPYALTYLSREMAKLTFSRIENFCPPWQMNPVDFLQSIIEITKGPSPVPKSSLKCLSLRCSLPSSSSSTKAFASLVLFAAEAALSFPLLEVFEIWGICLEGNQSLAYIFRYTYKNSRANITWRSCQHTMAARNRIMAKWSEVAQKHSHSTVTCTVVPFSETKVEIWRSNGTCIYQHLILRDLVFDPITRIILENELLAWDMDEDEDGDSSQQDDLLDMPEYGNDPVLPDSAGPDSDEDIEQMQAEVAALDAQVKVFIQQHWGLA